MGKRYQAKIGNELQHTKVDNVLNRAFIKRMDLAYAAADVVISRAGALSISEITLIGKPSILIPSPNVSEDHQTKNALSLVNQNAALLIKDDEAKQALESAVKLIDDENQMDVISSNAKSMGKPNATKDIIVVEISKLADKFLNIDSINRVHFIGIGGIGMSALAKFFLFRNIEVSDMIRFVHL